MINILALWREQLTPKSFKTIGSLWGQNTRNFFRILLRNWWWLIITTITGYLLFIHPMIKMLHTDQRFEVLIQLDRTIVLGLIFLTCMAFGMIMTISLLIAHSPEKLQTPNYLRSHLLFLAITTFITGFIFSIHMFSGAARESINITTYMIMSIERLYLFFACFFILDAKPSIRGYLRALIINPVKFLVLNLPITILLISINLLTLGSGILGLSILTQLFLVLCGVVYTVGIEKNREEYFEKINQ